MGITVREEKEFALQDVILGSNGGFRGFGGVKLILLEIW